MVFGIQQPSYSYHHFSKEDLYVIDLACWTRTKCFNAGIYLGKWPPRAGTQSTMDISVDINGSLDSVEYK